MRRDDLLTRLRAIPRLRPVLEALDGEGGVHVVGGAVRDALLGREPAELDLVVEGDAAAVARRAAARLGGAVVAHERFGTATVRAGELAFDLASARRETYSRPGALPDVELGAGIADDLRRRDFSVHALALAVADGELTAVPGALEDLAAGRLRVLHRRSFEDDPTRMLRMVRYAARLGFAVEEATAELVRPALLRAVSEPRIGAELRLLLREPQPAALAQLDAWALGREAVHAEFGVPEELVGAVHAACPPDARADLAMLAACCARIPPAALSARLHALGFPADEVGRVQAAATAQARLCDPLQPATPDGDRLPPSAVARILGREKVEAVVLVAARHGHLCAEHARWWLDEGRHVRLDIDGNDLVAAGLRGPEVGRALAAALAARLDGRAPGRADQLRAALESRA